MLSVVRYVISVLLVTTSVFASRSEAGSIVITGTRVVYPASSKEVTIKMNNVGDSPSLAQVWLDDGDPNSSPTTSKVPFTVAPPIFRLEPGKGQAVRVVYTKEPLPADKESLFWVNLLDVPPKPKDSGDRNYLQLAVQTRIKLFYRPDGLPGNAFDAAKQLTWKLTSAGNKDAALQVNNPTPYYVSFGNVGFRVGDRDVNGPSGGLVAPGSSSTFPIKELAGHSFAEVKARFTAIADNGALTPYTQPVSQ